MANILFKVKCLDNCYRIFYDDYTYQVEQGLTWRYRIVGDKFEYKDYWGWNSLTAVSGKFYQRCLRLSQTKLGKLFLGSDNV